MGVAGTHRSAVDDHAETGRHENGDHIKTVASIFLVFFGFTARADEWLLTLNRAGYFGKFSIGAIDRFSPHHETELSLGYSAIGNTNYGQTNIAYRYCPWLYNVEPNLWKPIQVGAFAVYSLDGGDYFFDSPGRYPGPGYYDRTNLRFGADFASTFVFENLNLEASYHVRIIDLGFVAIYNNVHRDLQYYISSGIALRYRF